MSQYWTVWISFSDGTSTFVRDVNDLRITDGVLYLADKQRSRYGPTVTEVDRGAYPLANIKTWTKETPL